MLIREAEEKDVSEVQKLLMEFTFIPLIGIKENIKKKLILIAEDQNKIIGMLQCNRLRNKISDLIVKKEFRKRNIGKQLFSFFIDKYSIPYLTIQATYIPYDSTAFWKRLGFSPILITGKPFLKNTKRRTLMYMEWGKEENLWKKEKS